MTTSVLRGLSTRLDIALTHEQFAVVGITRSDPPVVTKTAHGLIAGDAGYFSNLGGMHQLEGQGCLVEPFDADTFGLVGIDSSAWYSFMTGDFNKVTVWSTLNCVVAYDFGDPRPQLVSATRITDSQSRSIPRAPPPTVASIEIRAKTGLTTLQRLINSAAGKSQALTFRIQTHDGNFRVWRGVPSRFGESLTAGDIGRTAFHVAVIGSVVMSNDEPLVAPTPTPPPPPPPSSAPLALDGLALSLDNQPLALIA